MTVQDLIDALGRVKHKDAQVYVVLDWEETDDQGCQADLHKVRDVHYQIHIADGGFDFDEEHEILLEIEEDRA